MEWCTIFSSTSYFDARDTSSSIVCNVVFRYFMGQLCEIAEVFYKLNNLTVRILESRNDIPGSTASPLMDAKLVFVKYRLDFDNRDYVSTEDEEKGFNSNCLNKI